MLNAGFGFGGGVTVDDVLPGTVLFDFYSGASGDPGGYAPATPRSVRLVGCDEIEALLEAADCGLGCVHPEAPAKRERGCGNGRADVPPKQFSDGVRVSLFPTIGTLAKPGCTFPPDKSVEAVYETLNADKTINEFTVLVDNVPRGFMTRSMVNELLGGRYGFWLNAKRKIVEAAQADFLAVDCRMPVDHVTRLAMQRPYERLYNPIVVVSEGEYYGVATIKDVLDAYTKIEVEAAVSANPLTKLPGNLIIEGEIMRRIFGQNPYCIIYIDIDNFKAYNDAYGFENGDLILKFVADTITGSATNGEFVGHIGGDDFVVICDYHDGSAVCREIIKTFAAGINSFYRDTDLENGFIVSTNRHGVVDSFPIASLSIAGISNKSIGILHISDFSKAIAQLKKKCKKHHGNYFEIV
jgi:GGDEF domain-containing protein